ncbi:MAG: hypothetical protein IH782_12160, partial [candidate division NC10 bacterium]|nr:hypothetical protein [candidate division NC10 bacterium]
REVSLLPQFPKNIPAASINRACASANAAIAEGYSRIAMGNANVVIAGGAESLSDIPILHSRKFSDLLVALSKVRTLGQRMKLLATFRPRDLIPIAPAIAEPSTGETMGQSAEKMAKMNQIKRKDQDRFALRSHQLASKGTEDGRLTAEIAPFVIDTRVITQDNGVRGDTNLEKMAALKPVFDRKHGSVTAGNASPLTDGGAAVLLMGEDVATALGFEPLSFIRSFAVAALDPGDLFGSAAGHDESPLIPPFGSQVDDPIGGLDHLEVMLDHHHGVAGIREAMEDLEELPNVVEVQPRRRLVEHIEGPAGPPPG